MKKYLFIVNPVSGKGKGKRLIPWLRESLRGAGIACEIAVTNKSGDAATWSKAGDVDVVVAVGGDGTISEIAGSLVHSNKQLGIIPAGSGNDLIKSLAIPRDREGALKVALGSKTRRIDAGKVEWTDLGEEDLSRAVFVNGIGIGFDAAVAATANRLSYLSGTPLYLLSVLMTMRSYKAPDISVEANGVQLKSGRVLLIAVGNGACAGGGFFLTPDAEVDDAVLDLCAIEDRGVFGILRLIPKVLKGEHKGEAGILNCRESAFTFRSEQGLTVHADGEVLGTAIRSVTVGILEKALEVLAPMPGMRT